MSRQGRWSSAEARLLTLSPDSSKNYATVSSSAATLWNGGETLTVTTSGADVPCSPPARRPSKITSTSPRLPCTWLTHRLANDPFTATVDRGASSGNVGPLPRRLGRLQRPLPTCNFAASAGTGEILVAALDEFPAGVSGRAPTFVETSSTPALADWNIHFNATSAIVDATGAGAQGNTSYP